MVLKTLLLLKTMETLYTLTIRSTQGISTIIVFQDNESEYVMSVRGHACFEVTDTILEQVETLAEGESVEIFTDLNLSLEDYAGFEKTDMGYAYTATTQEEVITHAVDNSWDVLFPNEDSKAGLHSEGRNLFNGCTIVATRLSPDYILVTDLKGLDVTHIKTLYEQDDVDVNSEVHTQLYPGLSLIEVVANNPAPSPKKDGLLRKVRAAVAAFILGVSLGFGFYARPTTPVNTHSITAIF